MTILASGPDLARVVDWVLEHATPGSPAYLAAARLNNVLAMQGVDLAANLAPEDDQ